MQRLLSIETLINQHPFLEGMSRAHRLHFLSCGLINQFPSHRQLFHEGNAADRFYLIVEGAIALETFVPGSGMLTIQNLGPGEAWGFSWLFPPHKWRFTATTRESTQTLSFCAATLRAKAESDHLFCNELLARIARTLHDRLLNTRRQLIEAYGISA